MNLPFVKTVVISSIAEARRPAYIILHQLMRNPITTPSCYNAIQTVYRAIFLLLFICLFVLNSSYKRRKLDKEENKIDLLKKAYYLWIKILTLKKNGMALLSSYTRNPHLPILVPAPSSAVGILKIDFCIKTCWELRWRQVSA